MIAIGNLMPIDWRRRERARRFDHGGPIRYLPLAPVAGVMLVAAAMTAMAYPMQQHALLFDVGSLESIFLPAETPDPHRITLDRNGDVRWNGELVTPFELHERLDASFAQKQRREISFQPAANASFGETFAIFGLLKERTDLDYFCVEGIDRYRNFGKSSAAGMRVNADNAEFSQYADCISFSGGAKD